MLESNERKPSLPRAVLLPLLGVLYFLSARLGLSLGVAEQVTAVWPPSGIAIAALLVLGSGLWPGVWLGALAANLAANAPLAAALGVATGNTLEALAGAWMLRALGLTSSIARLRDVLALALTGAAAPAVAATVGVTSLCLGDAQPWSRFGGLWAVWWLGDAMGVLLVAPALLVWSSRVRARWSWPRRAELALVVAGLAWCAHLAFRVSYEDAPASPPFAYVVFPFVIWTALRFGQHGTTIAVLTAATVGTWATERGLGPFGQADGHRWLYLQGFLAVLAVTGLLLGAAIAERDRIERHRAAEHAVTRVLAAGTSLADTMPHILRALCESLAFDVGAWWRVEPGAGVLRCAELWSAPGVPAAAFEADSRARTFEAGRGLPGRVWSSARPAWIEDVVADPNFPRRPSAERDGLHGAVAFPVLLGGEIHGVLEVFCREPRRADARLLELCASIGSHIGQFIERKSAEDDKAGLLAAEHEARRRAEALAEELRREQSAKDRFLAMLGHELRNPLAPVTHAVQLLRMRAGADATTSELYEIMARQLRHMTRLVDDLLDVSRIGRGTIALRREPVDLAEVVRRVVETQRPALEERGHSLELSLPAGPTTVDGDPTRLDQLVSNLLHNAARYTPSGGRVAVEVERAEPDALVRVRDTGIGIRAEELARIFDVFTQADRVPGAVNEGLGIGLALVRQIAELHGGSVRAASEGPGRGSEFVVRLPLDGRARPAAEEPVDDRAPAGASARPRRILVVDDNRDSADTLATILRLGGHSVAVAYDGAEALERAAALRPEIVLLDIELPGGVNGYEVAKRLRAAAGEMELVALTGYGLDDDRRRSREAGFRAHLVKPVEPATLVRLVDGLGRG